jgi:hypothetical protein
MIIDEDLKTYATIRQAEIIDAINKYSGYRSAAKELGINISNVSRAIQAVKLRAASQGYSPQHDMTRTVPEPFVVRGISTYYNAEGKPSGQWVKSRINDEKLAEMVQATLDGMKDEIPKVDPCNPPTDYLSDQILNCYVITDYHLGMLSWSEETGADWDVTIAEDLIIKWFQILHFNTQIFCTI